MPRKKLTEEEKAAKKAEKEAILAAQKEHEEKLHKRKTFRDDLLAILILVLGVFLALALFTTTTGLVGSAVKAGLMAAIGYTSYILPFFLILYGVLVFANRTAYLSLRTGICFAVFLVLFSMFFAIIKKDGGAMGKWCEGVISTMLGNSGAWIIIVVGMLITLLFLFDTPLSAVFDNWKIKRAARKIVKEEEEQIAMKVQAELDAKREAEIAAEAEKQIEEIKHPVTAEQPAENTEVQPATTFTVPKLNLSSLKKFQNEHPSDTEETTSQPDIIEYNQLPDPKTPEQEPENILDNVKPDMPEELPEELPEEPYVSPFSAEEYTENQKRILDLVSDNNLFKSKKNDEAPKAAIDDYVIPNFEAPKDAEPEEAEKEPEPEPAPEEMTIDFTPTKVTVEDIKAVSGEVLSDIKKTEAKPVQKYRFPPLDLLKKTPKKSGPEENMDELAKTLENTMQSFGVNAKVVNITKGPAVTRFEVQPAVGVKVSSITKLHDDLALNLRAKSLRIEAPIPGKAAVGIEVSNSEISTVSLREIVESSEFKNHKSKIAVAIGRSINGDPVVCNIHNMPHLLIAGATGSGKSVCINSMLISMLYKATPQELKLILIDPKVVELSVYNGIPHLLHAVVTDPAKASAALGWAVSEMNERYNKFAEVEVRDLASYNEYVIANNEPDRAMPEIVIIIDELNDLIMAAKSTVEDSICRLAQKARACGMHLVVATQRPSVDVITGVIKANIPSRIAFAVSNTMDSRTILDEGGAEHLLGKGDMLYAPSGSSKPLRVQGCFVSDDEVKRVLDYVKSDYKDVQYNSDITQVLSKVGAGAPQESEADDEEMQLFKDCVECAIRANACSVSMLQRRFRIGYNRAARITEMMEERGIIGPADGSKQRKVNWTMEDFEQTFSSDENPDVPEEI